ncbi:MAG: radical SAM protein, partial [Parasporobacterium sp.]|nr:radical SAM protein [Parasporobacterium sp.]
MLLKRTRLLFRSINSMSISRMTDFSLQTIEIQTSEDGTRKFLFELEDGNRIETVYMQHRYGGSVCVSSQAGCSMACAFCASGLKKKVRDLSSREMLEQIFSVQKYMKEAKSGAFVTHAVVMGTGEPFDNYENVLDFCDQIT